MQAANGVASGAVVGDHSSHRKGGNAPLASPRGLGGLGIGFVLAWTYCSFEPAG